MGNIVIQATVNGFGSSVIAGYSAAVKLNNMVVTSFTTLGNGISNYTAQNIGAARYSRVRQGFWAGLRMVWVICVPLMAIYLIWAGQLVGFFMDEGSARAITTGTLFLRVLAPFYPVVSAKTGLGRHPARRRCNGALYGRHLYRSAAAGGAGAGLRLRLWRDRNLVCLAGRLAGLHCNVGRLLPAWQLAHHPGQSD